MVNNNVGAVTANIELNTKQFEEAVKKLKGDVKEIKESFNQKTSGNNGLLEEVKNLKKEIDSLREKTKNYQSTLKTVREENAEYAKTIKELKTELSNVKKSQDSFNKGLKEEQKNLDNASKSAKQYVSLTEKMTKWQKGALLTNRGKGDLFKLGSGYGEFGGRSKYADFSQWTKGLNTGSFSLGSVKKEFLSLEELQIAASNNFKTLYHNYMGEVKKSIELEKQHWSQSTQGITGYINLVNQLREALGKNNNNTVKNIGISFKQAQEEIRRATTLIKTDFVEVNGEIEVVQTTIGRVSDVLKAFSFQLLEMADAESVAAERTIELASAIQKMNAQGTANWSGRQTTGGYSNYISQSKNIADTLKKQAQAAKEAKLATDGLSQAYRKTNLNTYKANLNQINQTLEQQRLRTAQLEAAQQSIYYKNAPNNLNTYKMNMDKINQSLEKQTGNFKKSNQEIRTGQSSMREFGTTMGKAEAYSNNLYRGLQKVRSVIISFKTIMAAMGGMAVWNFAFELVDKAKETYAAKNEMESLLNKNSHVNAEGVQYFNEKLDETVSKFQRINKYGLGETAANIGLEFDLNAKEMAESLDVISMVQNEYIRAGRTVEEAGLAVKDILQGEFMRLSRETGVGKDDLIEKYGWNGKTEDVQDLMKALEKAGKARHWDLFAEKATSVDDVITITQNRFSEFGADLLTNIEPTIVGAFNGILDAVSSLKSGFEGMGTFGKYFTIGGGVLTAFTGISTALMMFKRNMGLAQIATLGWGRSFGTALLGLNKTDVALHGFWKTLLATTSGTKASTVANLGFTKSIAARLLGVKHSTAAEKGLLTAMVQSKMQLKGVTLLTDSAAVSSLKWYQKIGYLNGGLKATEVQTAGLRKSLLNMSVAAKAARLALLGIVSGVIIAGFASVAQWTDTVKKRMDTYRDVLNNGKEDLEDAKKDLEDYDNKLSELSKNDKNYDLTKKNRDTVKNHVTDLELSLKLAKQIKKENKEITKSHNTTYQGLINDAYDKNGVNIEKYGQTYLQMKQAAYDIKHAEDERYHFLYQSSQHINEQVAKMKEAKVSEEDRVKYITEYSSKAQEAAKNLKKFNQGDINAGAYYLINRAQLMWIDLWNNQHFIKFWEGVKKTWDEVKPSVYAMKDTLVDIGNKLLDFFSTDFGRYTGMVLGFGTAFGIVGLKIGKWITGSDSVFGVLKKVGGKLKDVAKGWKKVGDNAEEAAEKTSTSTGGINGEVGKGTTSLGTDLKNIGKNRAKSFANNALILAEGMALVTEAIVLIQAPMRALAWVGSDFKTMEADIRNGIEGLQLVAPVVGAILVPVLILHQVLSKYGKFMSSWDDLFGNLKAFATMMLGIAEGMVLVAEAIVMITPSIWALGALGDQFQGMETQVKKGTEAMKLVSDSLQYLLPFVPALAGGILLGVAIFESGLLGVALTGAVVAGVAIGMGLVAEAIWTLQAPLWAIGEVGRNYKDLSNVQQGAEAIKVTSEALKYVSDAMGYLTLIDLNLLAQNILDVVSSFLGTDLTGNLSKLTEENGVLDQLSSFVTKFNSDEFTIETINQDKVAALATAGDGIQTVGDAMVKVKTAMDNLPDEFKQGGTGNGTPVMTYDAKTDTTSVNTGDVGGYFDKFKEPLRQLKSFVYDFNHSEEFNIEQIDPDRVANISSAASMIETVNTAVEKVKTTMQNIGGSGHETAFAQGGALSALGYDLFHMTGAEAINNGQSSGEYKSSLGSQLKEMENVVSDIFTFQSNVSSMSGSGGENTNVDGATAMVTTIQTAISNLAQSLSDAVPTFEGKGNAISSALVNGVKKGLDGLGTGISGKVATAIDKAKPTAETYGKGLGWKVQNGFKTSLKIATTLSTEVDNALKAIDDSKKQEFYDKGNGLGSAFATGFKDGAGIHSPGYAAQAMQSEVGYIGQYITDGINNLPNLAIQLANSVSSNFNPSLSLGNFELPNISQFQQGITTITNMANNAKTQVSTKFNEMKTNIGTSFTNIKTNVGTSFSTILTNTRTSLNSMKSATIKNIGNIKTSWRGMQTALINSAENIKKQTGNKINNLKDNMASFWKKIQNPSTLISGAAGGHKGSIRRRGRPHSLTPKGQYAGGFNWKPKTNLNTGSPDNSIADYLKCLLETGKPCYAGGWSFNWNKPIQGKLNGWNTHFGKFHIDDYLKVGKFYNNSFPAKGIKEIAKAYIFDTIRATNYAKYFNSNFGEDPVAALNAGAFNCWDGTNIVLAIARAFGFDGSRGHGTWNGIGHVWANIPGLGIIDPTAIQNQGSFTSSAVKGYSAGSIRRGEAKQKIGTGDTHYHQGDTVVNVNAPVYGVDDLHRAIEDGVNKANRKLFRNSYSGV